MILSNKRAAQGLAARSRQMCRLVTSSICHWDLSEQNGGLPSIRSNGYIHGFLRALHIHGTTIHEENKGWTPNELNLLSAFT